MALILTTREKSDLAAFIKRHGIAPLSLAKSESVSDTLTVYRVAPGFDLHVRRCEDDKGAHLWTWIEYFKDGFVVESFKSEPLPPTAAPVPLISNITTDNSPYSIPETMRRFIGGVKPGFDFDTITTLCSAVKLVADFDNFIIFTRYMFETLEVSAYDHGAADHFANDADLTARMIAVMKSLGYSFELAPSQGSTSFCQMLDGKEARVIFWQHGEDSDNWDLTFTYGNAVTLRRDNVEGLDALIFAAFLENFNTMNPISEGLERLGFEENKDASVDGVTVFSRGEYEIHVSRGLSHGLFTAVYYYQDRDCMVLGNRIAADIVETAKLADTWE